MIQHGRYRRFSSNPFELGLFGFNIQNGLARLKGTHWAAEWSDNVRIARRAEEAGLEFLLPLGSWKGRRGYQVEGPDEGGSYESLIWAAGILAATERIAVFGTLHVAYINPVFAAKQVVTTHHIGHGRFGLNVVSGHREAEMFGLAAVGDHDAQYDYTEEWVQIAERIWSDPEPFDFNGEYFQLKQVLGKPKPYGGKKPMVISAGHSHRGRAFALLHADALFTSITELENAAQEIRMARAVGDDGARLPIYASGHMVCKPTRKEADEYFHHLVYELGDWDGIDAWVANGMKNRTMPYKSIEAYKERQISGMGTFLVRGSYDDAAETFKQLHDAGVNGMAVGFIDVPNEVEALINEVLPRMERLGLRKPASAADLVMTRA